MYRYNIYLEVYKFICINDFLPHSVGTCKIVRVEISRENTLENIKKKKKILYMYIYKVWTLLAGFWNVVG